MGIWRLGAVYVPLFTAFAGTAVAERVSDAGVKLIVTDTGTLPKVRDLPVQVLLAHTGIGEALAARDDLGAALVDRPEWTEPTSVSGPDTAIVQM